MNSQIQCPAWCTEDHSRSSGTPGVHSSGIVSVPVGGDSGELWDSDSIAVHAFTTSVTSDPLISLTAIQRRPEWQWFATFAEPVHAWNLARLLELLADASPEQHRDLAAAIRQTSALIEGEASTNG